MSTNTTYGPVQTAADGTYTLGDLPAGTYNVTVTADNYAPQTLHGIAVTAGQTTTVDVDNLVPLPGSISGTVTDASTNRPISGATVAAGPATATTAVDGTYTISGLNTDPIDGRNQYPVKFSAPGHLVEYWNGIFDPDQQGVLTLQPGEAATGIDEALPPGGATLVGTVTDPNGHPLANVNVLAATPDLANTGCFFCPFAVTGPDGSYAMGGLQASDNPWTISFTPPASTGLVSQSPGGVNVTDGQTIPIDAQLQPPGTGISGHVATAQGSFPSAGVTATNTATGLSYETETDSSDNYELSGVPAGTYTVEFTASGYANQWFNNKASQATADPVTVVSGQLTSGINATLCPTGSSPDQCQTRISGTVTNGSQPVAGATVVVHNYYGFTVTQTTTGSDGSWSVANLGGGVYRVEFRPPSGSGLVAQWWNNEPDGAHSDGVSVATGTTVANINAVLSGPASVSGTVTDANGPVSGALVEVFTPNSSNHPGSQVAHHTTAANGTYTITGLAPGHYFVLFEAALGSADVGQWFNNSPTASGATQLTLSPAGTATADAQLTAGPHGSIAGTVTDISGNPIAGISVYALAADGTVAATATTAADGTYMIANLEVGIDTVWFLPPAGSTYRASVWNAAVGKLLPIIVDQGSTITGINATLTQNGT